MSIVREQVVGPSRVRRAGPPADQAVYRQVYEAILDHRLPPGTKLTEDTLGDIFGVSRTIVRKALVRLEHDHIVETRPNRGAVVASPSLAEAHEVFDARRVIEREIVRAAILTATREDLDRLEVSIAAERAAYEVGDRRSWIRLSGDFHLCLAELAGNSVLTGFLKELVSRSSLIIALYESPGTSACSFDEHGALIAALRGADVDRAQGLMDRHLADCQAKLKLLAAEGPVELGRVFARPPG